MRLAAVLGLLLLCAPASPADEPTARRIAALRVLVAPHSLQAPRPVPERPGCPQTPWWNRSAYGLRARIEAGIRDASLRFGVERELIRSVIRHESAYAVDAVSHKGAQGLMQLMPETARSLGVVCPFDPRENVLGGTRYLRRLHERFGDWPRALAAYHAGPNRVEQARIPRETRRYVRRVMDSWRPGWRESLDSRSPAR